MTSVLVVDDEPMICKYTSRVLADELGVPVMTAANAEQALAILRDADRQVSVVLSDIRMPGHDGWWLAKEVRRRHPGTVCLLMSAYATEITDQVLPKPWSAAQLVAHVRRGLSQVAA